MVREYIVKIADDVTEDDDVLYGKPAKELIRCKDCRFSILIPPCNQRKCNGAMEKIVSDDFFCADGERR